MTPEQKQELIDLINSDDKAAEQVYKVLRALSVAHLTGRAIVSPKSKDAPVILISYAPELKEQIEQQLAAEGVKPTWDDDSADEGVIGIQG